MTDQKATPKPKPKPRPPVKLNAEQSRALEVLKQQREWANIHPGDKLVDLVLRTFPPDAPRFDVNFNTTRATLIDGQAQVALYLKRLRDATDDDLLRMAMEAGKQKQ